MTSSLGDGKGDEAVSTPAYDSHVGPPFKYGNVEVGRQPYLHDHLLLIPILATAGGKRARGVGEVVMGLSLHMMNTAMYEIDNGSVQVQNASHLPLLLFVENLDVVVLVL